MIRRRQPAHTTIITILVCLVSLLARMITAQQPGFSEVPLPDPDLSALETRVQDTLTTTRETLESALARDNITTAERGRVYGHSGKIFHAHHVFAVAEACYINAAALGDSAEWPYLLGYLYQDTGRFEEARDRYEDVLEIEPEHRLAILRLAQVLLASDQPDAAKPLLEQVVDAEGLAAAAHAGLASIAAAKGENEDAARHLERALELQPEADQLHHPLALAYRRLGDMDAARTQIGMAGRSKVQVDDPIVAAVGDMTVSSEMLLTTAAQALKAGRLDLAETIYREAITANPDNKRAFLNLSVLLAEQGRLDEGEVYAKEALRLSPDYFFAYLNLATINERRGNVDEALSFYRKALERNPRDIKTNFRYAGLLLRIGEYEQALEPFDLLAEFAPSLVKARYLHALALVGLGRNLDAIAVLDEALAISPDDASLRQAFARLLATTPATKAETQRRALELALSLYRESRSLETAETLAMCLAATGNFEQAVALQQRIVDATSDLGDEQLTDRLKHYLELYRQGRPADRPWSPAQPAPTEEGRGR
ncbi:MAG: tetratricopeptide repeat protein [Thermoanaerobaculales bacterium]